MKTKLHSEYFRGYDDLEELKEERGSITTHKLSIPLASSLHAASTEQQGWGVVYSYALTEPKGFGEYTHS